MSLSIERLREVIEYDHETGVMRWKVTCSNRRKAGELAGCSTGRSGRISLCIDYKQILANRAAWAHYYGEWPQQQVDHINGDPSDNRITNLRDVPQRVNLENQRGPRSNNTSGYLGVTRNLTKNGGGKKWRAKIAVRGKTIVLFYSDDPAECHIHYLKAKRDLHEGCTI